MVDCYLDFDFIEDKELELIFEGLRRFYFSQGFYQQVEPYCKKWLEIFQKKFTEDKQYKIADSYNCLGLVYYYQDNKLCINKAKENLEKALDIREKNFPKNHPAIAESYNNLGLLHLQYCKYLDEGSHDKAKDYLEKSLEIRQNIFDSNPSDQGNKIKLAVILESLAGLYEKTQKLQQAEFKCKKALEDV